MTPRRYLVHGLVLDVDTVLDLPRTDEPADVVLHAEAARTVPAQQPDGILVASREVSGRPMSFLVREGRTCTLRLPGLFEATIDLSTGVGTYLRDQRIPDGLLPILLPGTLLAAYFLIRGELVLHASAVHLDELGGAVAFVGSSGRGKSTLATLLCAAGGRLVTDDVLRVDLFDHATRCRRGTTAARLRRGAWPLLDHHAIPATATADGRRLAAVPTYPDDTTLSCVVLPTPDRESTVVQLRRLAPVEATMTITRHPRVLGWADPTVIARQFTLTTELVRRVPLFEARVPWGPPFPSDLATQLRAALRRQVRAPTEAR
ncbi:MAG: hypothetical protein ACRDRP_22735 [Pseudonocardiaceae bacterium]